MTRETVSLLALLALFAAPRLAAAAPVSLAPLFDTHTRFRPKKTVRLRFRARRSSGAAIAPGEIALSLRHGAEGAVPLPVRAPKPGVLEVVFTPPGPGQYLIVARLSGAPGAIPPVRLGVVGVVDGLVELPPRADADVMAKARSR